MARFAFRWDGRVPREIQKFAEHLSNPLALGFWDRITEWLLGIVERMFAGKGGMYDREKWEDISPSIYSYIRWGTDRRKHGWYRDRPNEPLVASGRYKASFKRLNVPRPTVMEFGSDHELAEVIPYAGHGPRHPIPRGESAQFRRELSEHVQEGVVFEALRRARA